MVDTFYCPIQCSSSPNIAALSIDCLQRGKLSNKNDLVGGDLISFSSHHLSENWLTTNSMAVDCSPAIVATARAVRLHGIFCPRRPPGSKDKSDVGNEGVPARWWDPRHGRAPCLLERRPQRRNQISMLLRSDRSSRRLLHLRHWLRSRSRAARVAIHPADANESANHS